MEIKVLLLVWALSENERIFTRKRTQIVTPRKWTNIRWQLISHSKYIVFYYIRYMNGMKPIFFSFTAPVFLSKQTIHIITCESNIYVHIKRIKIVCSGINRFWDGGWWQWRWWYRRKYIFYCYFLYATHITYYANIHTKMCFDSFFVLLLFVFIRILFRLLLDIFPGCRCTHDALTEANSKKRQNKTHIYVMPSASIPFSSCSFNSIFFWKFHFGKFMWFVNLYAFGSKCTHIPAQCQCQFHICYCLLWLFVVCSWIVILAFGVR